MRTSSFKAIVVLFSVALLGLTHQSALSQTSSFKIHDFTPDFWKFWDTAHDQPLDRQMQLWQDLYVSAHQGVFNDLAVPCKPQFDREWAKNSYFPNLPKITPAMRALSDGLRRQIHPATKRFLGSFPDMHWAGDIYIMASGYCFNGRAQTIEGRSAILFGIDTIAALNQQDQIPHLH